MVKIRSRDVSFRASWADEILFDYVNPRGTIGLSPRANQTAGYHVINRDPAGPVVMPVPSQRWIPMASYAPEKFAWAGETTPSLQFVEGHLEQAEEKNPHHWWTLKFDWALPPGVMSLIAPSLVDMQFNFRIIGTNVATIVAPDGIRPMTMDFSKFMADAILAPLQLHTLNVATGVAVHDIAVRVLGTLLDEVTPVVHFYFAGAGWERWATGGTLSVRCLGSVSVHLDAVRSYEVSSLESCPHLSEWGNQSEPLGYDRTTSSFSLVDDHDESTSPE